MTPRFEKAYNALVKAFFEGTLAKGTCVACAVGNIVADAQGGVVDFSDRSALPHCSSDNGFWQPLFSTDGGHQERRTNIIITENTYSKLSRNLEALTNYSEDEMAQIEYAFETNTSIYFLNYGAISEHVILEDQYRGLCAVVDVMLKLDGIEPDPKYAAKFREHKSLQHA